MLSRVVSSVVAAFQTGSRTEIRGLISTRSPRRID
jgi:hypothetical protein